MRRLTWTHWRRLANGCARLQALRRRHRRLDRDPRTTAILRARTLAVWRRRPYRRRRPRRSGAVGIVQNRREDAMSEAPEGLEVAATGTYLTECAPDNAIPDLALAPVAAMRLVEQELAVEGQPERNLATFVTTWMEPEARELIDQNLHRNFIDHA